MPERRKYGNKKEIFMADRKKYFYILIYLYFLVYKLERKKYGSQKKFFMADIKKEIFLLFFFEPKFKQPIIGLSH
jgi:hypothetical protein